MPWAQDRDRRGRFRPPRRRLFCWPLKANLPATHDGVRSLLRRSGPAGVARGGPRQLSMPTMAAERARNGAATMSTGCSPDRPAIPDEHDLSPLARSPWSKAASNATGPHPTQRRYLSLLASSDAPAFAAAVPRQWGIEKPPALGAGRRLPNDLADCARHRPRRHGHRQTHSHNVPTRRRRFPPQPSRSAEKAPLSSRLTRRLPPKMGRVNLKRFPWPQLSSTATSAAVSQALKGRGSEAADRRSARFRWPLEIVRR